MVRLSRFTHFIDVSKEGGMSAIYNSLTQSVMYVSTQLAEALKNIGIQTVECFIEQYFQEDREEAYNLLKHLWNMRLSC